MTTTLTAMNLDRRLNANTQPGARFVEICEIHAAVFAERAAEHDRDRTFGFENWEDLKASGALNACIPTELGGLGVNSIHDVAIGVSRLAAGDASMAIGANMHLALPWAMARQLAEARATNDAVAVDRLTGSLQMFGAIIFCGPSTEPGNDVFVRPTTTATPTEGGYVVNGTKIFGTNAPIADVFGFWVSIPDPDDGPPRMATAVVPRGTPGMTIHDDWDALGMRASGSCTITFEQCFVPEAMVNELGITGQWNLATAVPLIAVTFPLLGTFVGIAEASLEFARRTVTTKRKGPSGLLLSDRHGVRQLIAEAEIALAGARAALERTANLIDAYFDEHHPGEMAEADMHQLYADFQCTNVIVKRAAVTVVDKAMNAVGGSSYLTASPLSRHWRDVRAGSFMQPFTPVEAYTYIANVALDRPPAYDD